MVRINPNEWGWRERGVDAKSKPVKAWGWCGTGAGAEGDAVVHGRVRGGGGNGSIVCSEDADGECSKCKLLIK